MKNWTHKVVKLQFGGDGKLFAYRGRAFETEEKAIAYARDFAARQAGVAGTLISVKTRGGRTVKEFRPPELATAAGGEVKTTDH
jgi:hypothetical protein